MRIASILLITSLAAAAQAPSFDVASVKVSQLGKSGGKFAAVESISPEPNGVTMNNVSLLSCIRWAYDVKEFQISGPGWMESERYDIAAKAAGTVPLEESRRMLQTLLHDRFQLALHNEEKELSVYALVAAKGGVKLQAAKPDSTAVFKLSEGSLIFLGFTLPEFADKISAGSFRLDRPIIDRTGLTEKYDLSLKLFDSIVELKRSLEKAGDPVAYQNALAPLGLRLEPQKGPYRVLVIDRAEKVPTGN